MALIVLISWILFFWRNEKQTPCSRKYILTWEGYLAVTHRGKLYTPHHYTKLCFVVEISGVANLVSWPCINLVNKGPVCDSRIPSEISARFYYVLLEFRFSCVKFRMLIPHNVCSSAMLMHSTKQYIHVLWTLFFFTLLFLEIVRSSERTNWTRISSNMRRTWRTAY
jgi:hypothetical protein